jgi:hypothetical protein
MTGPHGGIYTVSCRVAQSKLNGKTYNLQLVISNFVVAPATVALQQRYLLKTIAGKLICWRK